MHEQERERRANRDRLIELGVDPHGSRVDGLLSLEAARCRYDGDADEAHQASKGDESFVDRRPVVKVGGRVMLLRDNGKLIWLNLRDETGSMQVAISKRDCSNFDVAQCMDLGDIVVAEGPLMK
ncbi:MAG: lysine--tRNA ligase, partial [Phycisphaerales bacterium]|nr:lysine--tRNA ligase [Phycisphaerales bacterium]